MKILLRLEEAGLCLLAGYLLYQYPQHLTGWQYLLGFFIPDISIAAYLAGPFIGAQVYNLFHHKAIAVAMIIAGACLSVPLLQLMGYLFLAHSCFDRILGYGLKYPDDFKHTSSGYIGRVEHGHPDA